MHDGGLRDTGQGPVSQQGLKGRTGRQPDKVGETESQRQ